MNEYSILNFSRTNWLWSFGLAASFDANKWTFNKVKSQKCSTLFFFLLDTFLEIRVQISLNTCVQFPCNFMYIRGCVSPEKSRPSPVLIKVVFLCVPFSCGEFSMHDVNCWWCCITWDVQIMDSANLFTLLIHVDLYN